MNEELERIKQGLVYGSKLDVYDRKLILKIINEQQKEIEYLQNELKKFGY